MAETHEVKEWKAFRSALPKGDRTIFDDMLNTARLYTSASSAAVRTSRFEGMTMAVIFHHQVLLTRALGAVSEIRRREGQG